VRHWRGVERERLAIKRRIKQMSTMCKMVECAQELTSIEVYNRLIHAGCVGAGGGVSEEP
jgi:hypothetical protein